ncbi:HutD family protein [Streptomyces sp. MBT53]|uniref:HutD/Ves family protein n=1 Tax=Streptomyces sp. MBT53 TaxID=1488384 RepID=UPI00191351BB|nr:HutD family protein [Streptomyces sp. MBT53]MBK6016223.1 HutD family protein [Streptomyces sp. MBT53]
MTRLLPASARTAVPWKNGGGVTREIAAWPEGSGMDDFVWRVSLAEVRADGPFSAFPDVDRTLTVVDGAGMDLTVGGERVLVNSPYVPHDFRGDLPTEGRLLDGPVVNLNVMWRRGAVATAPTVAVVRGRLRVCAGALAVALDGVAEVAGVTLGPYDAVKLGDEEAVLHARGRTAVIGLSLPADAPLA